MVDVDARRLAGEDVRVEDADTGDDLTSSILSKIIAEGNRKGGALELMGRMLREGKAKVS